MPILNWLGRDEALKTATKTPYRLLEEVPELGYGDKSTDNMIIQGDNLEALKALLPFYAGQVKCIYIDPPYNTGNAFEHYDDNVEHSIWLSLMYPRLELLKEFLSEDGAIFISIDETEAAYLKVVLDEIFGRTNYIGQFIWQKKRGGGNDSRYIAIEHEYVLCVAKNVEVLPNWHTQYDEAYLKRYSEQDDKGRYFWDTLARPGLKNPIIYDIVAPDGTIIRNGWVRSQKRFEEDLKNGEIRVTKNKGNWSVQFKQYMGDGKKPRSLLTDVAINSDAKQELVNLFGDAKTFPYPKPENLVKYIFNLYTKSGDLVLDSFLGSGTTAAVAQKMGRRYIGIEMGNHAITHCVPRLKAVVDGEQGGISKAVNWQGGGGFRFYKLGNEVFDADGCINEGISFEDLSAHIWFTETKTPFNKPAEKSTFLGIKDNVAYALLYNGILKDKRVDGGNVLTNKTLKVILDDMQNAPYDKLVIYGESSRISQPRLKSLNIEFKQTPYDIKAR